MQIASIALEGLTHAQDKIEKVARNLSQGLAATPDSVGDHVDLSRDITDLLVARESFEANIAVLETVADLEAHVLDILA